MSNSQKPLPSATLSRVFKPRVRRNFPRSKAGCLTCRLRRKKCDESHPICGACHRKELQCSWPGQNEHTCRISHQTTNLEAGTNRPRSSSCSEGTPSQLLCQQWSLSYKRDSLLYPSSRLLFDRYLSKTSNDLGIITAGRNPFIHCVLPLAFSDELVMNCVLALAGVNLSEDVDATDPAITPTTWKHYSLVLSDLQLSISGGANCQERSRFHLLLVTLFLCLVEVMSGNSQMTNLHHLKASRQLALSIMSTPCELESPELRDIGGFLLEMYSYRALIASITPQGALDTQMVPLDPFPNSLGTIGQYRTFGVYFDCGHDIRRVFEFIPEVSLLTNHRLAEERSGIFSSETYQRYKLLGSRIRAWAPEFSSERTVLESQKATVAIIYQNALLMYLNSFFHDPILSDPDALSEVEIRAGIAFSLLLSLSPPSLKSIMLWPSMMIGSCLRQEAQQNQIREGYASSNFHSRSVKQGAKLLDLLWEDPDTRAYGPRGLDFVMKKHGWSLCMT